MDALETLLTPVARMMNRQIALKTPARELCRELDGRLVAVRVKDTALAMYFEIDDGRVELHGEAEDEPDVVISGSLPALLRLAGSAGDAAVRDGAVELAGDGEIAERFQRLLKYARPDLEEELSGLIGDAAAHGIGNFARGVGSWGRQAAAILRQNLREYLEEERQVVPGRYEMDAFRRDVDAIRDDVARFEARLRQYEEKISSGHERG